MSETLDDLARRLVAHPRWKWRAGMLLGFWSPQTGLGQCRYRVVEVDVDGIGAVKDDGRKTWGLATDGRDPIDDDDFPIPDLTDPATGGVLLDMLYAAVRPRALMVALVPNGDGYGVACVRRGELVDEWPWDGDTLGEAAARALLEVWDGETLP